MTHEQKPESAEFRTRDAQIEAMATNYMEIGFPLWEARKMATDDLTEAEARGAAEQRRKDAEGMQPVAWLISDRLKGKPGCAHMVDRTTTNRAYAEYQATLGFDVTPLCSKGSNVTALEARVKELEAEVEAHRTAWQWRTDRIAGRVPMLKRFPEADLRRRTAEELIAEAEAIREGGGRE